jgi:hypothetical protein
MNWIKALGAFGLTALLAGCGGGGDPLPGTGTGGGTGGGSPNGVASITVSLSSATVTAGAPATVSALVRDATGAGVTGKVVSFTTTAGLGTFSVNSALTDATGTAVVSLSPASSTASGADEVIARATVSGVAVSDNKGFQLTATSVSIAGFTSDLASLSAYGQTTLSVVLSGATASTPVNVAVSSACVSKGKATLTPSSATTTTGAATFTYRDQGCGATDINDSLQASVAGTAAIASLSIGLTSPSVSSITFVTASAPTIYLKGSGLNETSLVTFQVRDTAGNGLPNQNVLLVPTTLTGGLTLDGGSSSVTKLSDSLGNVLVRINSGTVPTPVRIKASLVSNTSVSTVSSNLAIAVGLPSQLNFSLSQGTRNIEGYNIDGTPNTYNIIASDRLGNPVPDDTAINFVAEGGQVEAIKFTALTAGLARTSANFVSAEPRPVDGRVTIVAYALGEESFLDTNGNNVYDAGEDFQELGNLFLDRYFDGYYDKATDQFISLSISAASNCSPAASSLLAIDKTIPSIAQGNSSQLTGTCDGAWGRAYVRRALETVLSTSEAWPVWYSKPANLYDTDNAACLANIRKDVTTDPTTPKDLITGYVTNVATRNRTFYSFGGGSLYGVGAAGALSFLVADANPVRLNPMPAGTTVSASATTGLTVKVEGGSPVPSTAEATFTTISYEFAVGTLSGRVNVTFTSPAGLKSTFSQSISTASAPGTLILCP